MTRTEIANDPARIAEMISSVAPDAIVNCAGLTAGGNTVTITGTNFAPGTVTSVHRTIPG